MSGREKGRKCVQSIKSIKVSRTKVSKVGFGNKPEEETGKNSGKLFYSERKRERKKERERKRERKGYS